MSSGLISGKDKCYVRPKNGRKYLKFEICVGNDYGLALCENLKVKGESEEVKLVETRCMQIEVWQSKRKIGEGRRHMIGWLGNTNNWQLIH